MLPPKLQHLLGTAMLLSPASSAPSNTQDCCLTLSRAGLPVYLPNTTTYADQISSYWSLTAQQTPYCIVQPATTSAVALTLTTLVQHTQCNFAVRSGGHSSNSGFNNIEEGVTIDLSAMAGVSYDPDTALASVLPATRWMQVYRALDPLGRGVPGGRLGHVGVGGLATGGGFSFYLYREGLACDSVAGFEAVLANGEVVEANAESNADLWAALKGGMGNFGIVTRLDLQTFATEGIWGGGLQWEAGEETKEKVVKALVGWTDGVEEAEGGESQSVIVIWEYVPSEERTLVVTNLNDVSGRGAAPAFDPFFAIPDNISSSITARTNMSTLAQATQAEGYRNIWFTVTFKNEERVVKKAIELHDVMVEEMKVESFDGDFQTQAFFQPFPTVVAKHSVEKGGNTLGIDSIDDNAIVLLGSIAVNGVDQEALSRGKMMAWKDALEEYTRSIGAYVEYRYANYADRTQDVVRTYGEENIRNMWAVSEKFDPDGIFQTRAPGGFKLPAVA